MTRSASGTSLVLLAGATSLVGALAVMACGSDASERPEDTGREAGAGDAPTLADVSLGDTVSALGDVEAVVTADNAFSFGYGSETGLSTYIPGGPASHGSEIFDCPVGRGPHAFVVPAKDAPASAFLYIVAWADTQTTQGVLAQFKRSGGVPLYSGSGAWQVCALDKFFDAAGGSPGPDQAAANQAIVDCNAGATGDTNSKGWVATDAPVTPGAVGRLAFGETNESAGGDFPIVCQSDDAGVKGIDPFAKWMWFDPQDGQSPFVGNSGNRTKTFLVFRLAASALVVK